jgi:hypothetical protein
MSSSDYSSSAPGINIQGRGELVFDVAVPSGSSITASVYAKTPDSNYSPRFLIRDPYTYVVVTGSTAAGETNQNTGGIRSASYVVPHNFDVGGSWANNTWQQLTVHAPTTTYDRMYELVISGSAGTDVTSSFSDFNVVITGSG